MMHQFGTTDLKKNYRVNLNMIGLDARPQVKNLVMILKEWLNTAGHRDAQIAASSDKGPLHILEGLLIAFLNIDEVIRIIRYEDEPKKELMKTFGLTDIQAEAILELKLRHLAKLEEKDQGRAG